MALRNEIEKYIIDFCAYNDEPLHIIISAVINEGLCQTPRSVADAIIKLASEGYVSVSTHSGRSGDEYVPIAEINEHELMSDIEKRGSFSKYPDGKEYFLKTTQEGMKSIQGK